MKSKIIAKFIIFSLLAFSMLSAGDDEELNDPAFYDFHKVTWVHLEFDPYEGTYIDQYWFLLDNNILWRFDWNLFESNKISLKEGDQVKLIYSGASHPNYWMTIYSPTMIHIVEGIPNADLTEFRAFCIHTMSR